jgi:hypothetical protein
LIKKIIILLVFLILPLYLTPDEKFFKWAYIAHYSNLNQNRLKTALNYYDKICLTGWELSQNSIYIDKKAILHLNSLKEMGMSMENFYPLIVFKNRTEGIKILSGRNSIIKTAKVISDFATRNSFKNIHLDFEYIPPEYSNGLADLLKEIRSLNKDLKITMALFPQIDFPTHLSGFHKPDNIAQYIDEIVLMCYDYKKDSKTPVPVTDISWAEKNIIHILKFFKPEQVYLGVPAYGYTWPDRGNPHPVAAAFIGNMKSTGKAVRDVSGCVKIDYIKNGIKYTAYVSDKDTIQMLEDIARRYKLKGTGIWRFGFL